MKHSASREFFAYWDGKRAGAAAPERSDLEPQDVRQLLGDIFVLSYDRAKAFRFAWLARGSVLCSAVTPRQKALRNCSRRQSRGEFEDVVGIVAEEAVATVCGVTADGADGSEIHLELLLLPFSAQMNTPLSLTGLFVPIGRDDAHAFAPLKNFKLTSWRHAGPKQKWIGPRRINKWSLMRGLTVYEGLR